MPAGDAAQSVLVICVNVPIGSEHVVFVLAVKGFGHTTAVAGWLQVVPLYVKPLAHADVTIVSVALAVLFNVPLIAVTWVTKVADSAPVVFRNLNVTVVTPEASVVAVQVSPAGAWHETKVWPVASGSVTVTVLPRVAPLKLTVYCRKSPVAALNVPVVGAATHVPPE